MLKGQGNLPQGEKIMRYELDKTAWGYGVVKIVNGKKWYISKVHRDGTYDFTGDYTYAKRWSKKIAEKHLEIAEGSEG